MLVWLRLKKINDENDFKLKNDIYQWTKTEIIIICNLIKKVLSLFKKSGIKVIMATGDNEKIASLVAKESGIDEYISNCLPTTKKELIDEQVTVPEQISSFFVLIFLIGISFLL